MKNLLLVSGLLIASFTSYSQDKNQPQKSNLEKFTEQPGTFSKTEYTSLGKVKTLLIEIVKVNDLINDKNISGIKFSGFNTVSSKMAVIDKDEIKSLVTALDYINEKVYTSTIPSNTMEYNFYSRGGFSMGVYKNDSDWKGYIQLDKFSSSLFYLKKEDFKLLQTLLKASETL